MSDTSKSCPICSEEYNATKQMPLSLPCGHVFCDDCLGTLEDGEDQDCPECRKSWVNSPRSSLPIIFCLIDNTRSKKEEISLELAKLITKYGATAIKNGVQTFDRLMEKSIRHAGLLFSDDPDEVIEIYVKDLRGRSITILLRLTCTVESLKILLQQHLGIAPDQQLLLYKGRALENGRTLAIYNVKGYTTIHAVCRQLGG